eukprot:CAMPEP_0115167638 /NCGR_PEP_ID=MMETSP0270-20121206/326_1 /TAXON_ID=71861 /ORGANISM="Scrippsiella trochoidea, Strain CCMP3099" /LENGTH=103 /DNA_ID=CAMNT_0002580251 /DNA_START=2771 /DNA_END=3082 /DNA_ORIENTATION=+
MTSTLLANPCKVRDERLWSTNRCRCKLKRVSKANRSCSLALDDAANIQRHATTQQRCTLSLACRQAARITVEARTAAADRCWSGVSPYLHAITHKRNTALSER